MTMVTIQDVAEHVGVNKSTVSRALSGHHSVSEKTRAKIEAAIRELGFVPNATAKMLALGKVGVIGVIFPPVAEKAKQPFFMKILTAINNQARLFDKTTAIVAGHIEEKLLQQVRLMHLEGRVDGFIKLYVNKQGAVCQYLSENHLPYVLVGSPEGSEISYVDSDNFGLGRDAVDYLRAQGHEQIAFVTDVKHGHVYRDRFAGSGLAASIKFDKDFVKPDATAIIAMDDGLARQIIDSLSFQGVRVPEDISVLCFNNSFLTELIHPHLTAYDISVGDLGQAAVKIFEKLANEGKNAKARHKIIGHRLIERESVRKV